MLQKGASGEGQVVQSRTGITKLCNLPGDSQFIPENCWEAKLFWGNRSSRREMFCKQGVLRNFAKFTGKNLRQKVAGLKRRLRCFPVIFCDISRTPFFIEHLWRLVLKKKPQPHNGRICVTFKLEKQPLRRVCCIEKILLNSWKISRELLVTGSNLSNVRATLL